MERSALIAEVCAAVVGVTAGVVGVVAGVVELVSTVARLITAALTWSASRRVAPAEGPAPDPVREDGGA